MRATITIEVEVKIADTAGEIKAEDLTLEMDYSRCFPTVNGQAVGRVVGHQTTEATINE
jgi:hypothetical protein